MPNQSIVPCLWFDDQAERAVDFYTRLFPRGRITARSYYPAGSENPAGKAPGSVLTVEFEIAGQSFTALNGGPHFTINPSISFFAYVETPAEVDRLFAPLEDGGQVLMELGEYPWSKRYGWVRDRFGVNFQVIATGQPSPEAVTIAPCLMFAGSQHGRAEEAMQTYARILPGSRIEQVERYAAGEGPAGTVKHGRFQLAGQPVVAMDSHVSHDVTFNEAVSLQVMCKDQAEVDRLWAELSQGGETGPCGWLKDRFGLSWQVVPSNIVEWMTSQDVSARERAFAAVMGMGKLDIAAIEAAFRGA